MFVHRLQLDLEKRVSMRSGKPAENFRSFSNPTKAKPILK
jgi:hypothetical protein